MSTHVKDGNCFRFPLSAYPGLNRFALDLVDKKGSAAEFVHRVPTLQQLPSGGRPRDRAELVHELEATNRGWGNEVAESLRHWLNGQTVTLIAGQQVGFGGGPLYTFAKIASLLKIQSSLESQGRSATIFFWMATEDHDFDEVATLSLPDGAGLRRIRSSGHPNDRRTVGSLAVPESLRTALSSFLGVTDEGWLEKGITFRDSFARLIAEVFAGRVILVDSLLPSLRRLGSDLFRQVVDGLEEAESLVECRSEQLRSAGYTPQIVRRDGEHFPFLFQVDALGVRHAVQKSGSGWEIGETHVSIEDVHSRIVSAPESISTGAVLRPLLQDLVFETDLFVGGPAEVAYYAQLGGLYEKFSIRQPHVALRGHALITSRKRMKVFERYGLQSTEVFDTPDEVIARQDPDALETIEQTGRSAAELLEREVAKLEALALPVDRSLEHSIRKTRAHLEYHLRKLVDRTRSATIRRNSERYKALGDFQREMMPGGVPQDRMVAWLPFWKKYGHELTDAVVDAIQPDSATGVVVGL